MAAAVLNPHAVAQMKAIDQLGEDLSTTDFAFLRTPSPYLPLFTASIQTLRSSWLKDYMFRVSQYLPHAIIVMGRVRSGEESVDHLNPPGDEGDQALKAFLDAIGDLADAEDAKEAERDVARTRRSRRLIPARGFAERISPKNHRVNVIPNYIYAIFASDRTDHGI